MPTRTLATASNKCWVQIDRKTAAGLSPPPPGPLAPKEGKQKEEREEEEDLLLPSVPEIVKSVEKVIENAVRISLISGVARGGGGGGGGEREGEGRERQRDNDKGGERERGGREREG